MEENASDMEFTRVGKTYQLIVNNGNDLRHALYLDEALWAATSAPAGIFRCDPAFIKVLDPNQTGRITAKALKEAIAWLLSKVKDPATITQDAAPSLPLAQLNPDTAQPLLDSATYILRNVCATDATAISLQQIRDFFANVAKLPFNGDAVISLAGAREISEDYAATITDAVTATGGTKDADGTIGASQQNITDFIAAVRDYLAWFQQGLVPDGQEQTDTMPCGKDTPALYQLVKDADPLVQHVFKLSRLMAFDRRIAGKTMGTDAKLAAFDSTSKNDVDAFLQDLPLAQPTPDITITLDSTQVNPTHATLWKNLTDKVVRPLLGQDLNAVTPQQWDSIKATFAPFDAYLAAKKGACVEQLSLDRLTQLEAAADSILATTQEAIQRDKIVADINAAAKEVEKLLLLRTYAVRFANNFISFPELYDPDQRALFEQGSLVIDGRWFNLAFKVDAVPAHQALAKKSLLCIIYAEITPNPTTKFTVAVPVTYGSIGNLAVGKRGVFIDLDGHEFDAKVTHLIANPVCLREALLAPFLKMGKLVEGKIETWSNATEKNALADFNKVVANPGTAIAPPAQPAKPPVDKQGMFLGASVAIAALGSAFAFISNTLSAMSSTALAITVICAILALVAPLSIMAIIKLRKQDLSALLEGCGWAINLRMKLTTKLRGQFTRFGNYPKDAKGTPKSRALLAIIVIILIIAMLSYAVNWIAQNTEWGQHYAPQRQAAAAPAKAAAKPAPANAAAKPATAKPAPVKK